MTVELSALRALPGFSVTELAPGYPLLHLQHGELRATVSLYGGQLIRCQRGEHTLLWSNPDLQLKPGKALRAGVPVCWPWFGTLDSQLPAHGFVRTRLWQLASVQQTETALTVTLEIQDDADTRALWPHRFSLQLQLRLSDVLAVQLLMHNRDDHAFPVAGALHSYFAVRDIAETQVDGLDGMPYLDQLSGEVMAQNGSVTFDAETDRIYQCGPGQLQIRDRQSTFSLRQHGNTDTVVWTPWTDKAARLGDVTADNWRQFVCVETAISNDRAIVLAPGASYAMGFTLNHHMSDPAV